jgi:hypothetical protein
MARTATAQKIQNYPPPKYIPLGDLGTLGIIKDRPGHELPPEAFTDGNNIRFLNRNVRRILGHTQVYGTPLAPPDWIFEVPAVGQDFWLYGTKTNAYAYDGTHHDITRLGGSGIYGTARQWDWNFTIIGGVPILNNAVDDPQYWPTLNSAVHLANLPNWPAATQAKEIQAFGQYLVAINIISAGVAFPHMVWWSAKTPPGTIPPTWNPADATHDAGQEELTDIQGGEGLTGVMLGNFLVIYKRTSTHVMRFIGGQDVMGFEMILSTSGALTHRTACAIDKGSKHFVVSQDDALEHQGYRLSAKSVLNEREREFLFNDIDSTNFVSAFSFDNAPQREAWFCYPSGGNTIPNKVLIYNYQFNTIQFRDFDGLYADVGNVLGGTQNTWNQAAFPWNTDANPWGFPGRRGLIYSSPGKNKLYQLDSGLAFDTAAPVCFIERQGLAIIGRDQKGNPIVDYNSRKLLSRLWPKVQGTSILSIKTGAQEQIGGAVTWQPAQNFNPATQKYLDFVANGRLLAYNISSSDNNSWELQGLDIEVSVLGNL